MSKHLNQSQVLRFPTSIRVGRWIALVATILLSSLLLGCATYGAAERFCKDNPAICCILCHPSPSPSPVPTPSPSPSPSPTPIPTPSPSPSPSPSPTSSPLLCPSNAPPLARIILEGRKLADLIVDATPKGGPDEAWCLSQGFTDPDGSGQSFCPYGPEGSVTRLACEKAKDPWVWSWNDTLCTPEFEPGVGCQLNNGNILQIRVGHDNVPPQVVELCSGSTSPVFCVQYVCDGPTVSDPRTCKPL